MSPGDRVQIAVAVSRGAPKWTPARIQARIAGFRVGVLFDVVCDDGRRFYNVDPSSLRTTDRAAA
jgi:hypothetical protein